MNENHLREMNSLIAGYEAQIIAEGFVVAGCESTVLRFLRHEKVSDLDMRLVRISNDAKANIRFAQSSLAATRAMMAVVEEAEMFSNHEDRN